MEGTGSGMQKGSLEHAHNQFGLEMFQHLAKRDCRENLLISPTSLALMLSMAAVGASDQSQKELNRLLHHDMVGDEDDIKKRISNLIDSMMKGDPKVDMILAHSAWTKGQIEPKKDWVQMVKKVFHGQVQQFKSWEDVLGWVKENTGGMINKWYERAPAPEPGSDDHMGLLMMGAVYFGGHWLNAFDEKDTQEMTWHSGHCDCKVHMMHSKRSDFRYFEKDHQFQMLELPFGSNHRFAICLLLPHESMHINEFIGQLDMDSLNKWRQSLSEKEGEVYVPRMHMMHGPMSMSRDLRDMGLSYAFKGGFDRIAPNLHLSDVMHKSVLEFNEKGVKAGAAHGAGFGIRATASGGGFQMKCNRPFILSICDCETSSLVYLCRVMNPSE